jgi:hypothetical protein
MATVVLQLGHVDRKTGATGTTGEQALARRVAPAAARMLREAGHRPVQIFADDPVPGGDVFIAIHADGSTSPRARGCSFGFRPGLANERASRAFGAIWQVEHVAAGYPGGTRAANYTPGLSGYYALRPAARAGHDRAIVLELGFLTNQDDREWLTSPDGVDSSARAITAAVVRVHGGRLPSLAATPVTAAVLPPSPPRSWLDMVDKKELTEIVRDEVRKALAERKPVLPAFVFGSDPAQWVPWGGQLVRLQDLPERAQVERAYELPVTRLTAPSPVQRTPRRVESALPRLVRAPGTPQVYLIEADPTRTAVPDARVRRHITSHPRLLEEQARRGLHVVDPRPGDLDAPLGPPVV